MSKEKLFVICEVKKTTLTLKGGEQVAYVPVQSDPTEEIFWLHPSRIIRASRLRYGVPVRGEVIWREDGGWDKATGQVYHQHWLILDPEPEEKDEWDEWADSMPHHQIAWREEWIQWLKRMPRREK